MQTIDMTPTWAGLLPALLEAHANVKRQLFAGDECDGFDNGWCSVHDSSWADESVERDGCERFADKAALAGWRQGAFQSLKDIETELGKMAKGADMAVAIQKVFSTTSAPETEREVLISAILTGGVK